MINLLTIILSLVFLACSRPYEHQKKYEDLPKDEVIADDIMSKAAERLKKEKGLQPIGSGGRMMDEVKMLMLAFTYNHPVDIEEGRKLLVYAVETFLSVINEDERIRPYLYNYPFEPKNIKIQFFIRNPDHSSVELGKICIVSAEEGIIEYEIRNKKTTRLETIHEETFAEAKEKLKQSRI